MSGTETRIYYGYWLVAAAFVAQFFAVGVQNYVIGPFMTPMIEDMAWTRAEYTLPRAIGQVVAAAAGFIIGSYVDRLGARRFMLAGTIVLSIALWLMSHITTLLHWVLLNGLILTAGASLIGNLVVNVTLAKWFVDFRGRAVALAAMGVSFAGVLLTPLTTWVIDEWGWRAAWQGLAGATFCIMIPIALAMRRAPEDYDWLPDGRVEGVNPASDARARADFARSLTRRQALRTASFYVLVAAFALFSINIQVMLLQTIPFMTDAGYERTTGALMITLASVPAMISKPIWGIAIDRLEPKPLAAASSLATGVALVLIVFAASASADLWLYAGFVLLGLGWGGMIPLMEVIWAAFFGRRYLGEVRSASLPFTLLLTAGAPVATSWYYDVVGNYDGAILLVAGANVVAAIMLLTIRPPISTPQVVAAEA